MTGTVRTPIAHHLKTYANSAHSLWVLRPYPDRLKDQLDVFRPRPGQRLQRLKDAVRFQPNGFWDISVATDADYEEAGTVLMVLGGYLLHPRTRQHEADT
jgi:hypothetical protein